MLFVQPGGNWGDQLIYSGALALAERYSIECITLDHDDFLRTKSDFSCPVYLHGGGGLNPWTSGRAIRGLYHAVENYSGIVIQGPQTISEDHDFVASFASTLIQKCQAREILFFSREVKSHDIAKAAFAGSAIECLLDQDTAFHNCKADLVPYRRFRRKYNFRALRQDNEQTGWEREFSQPAFGSKTIVLDPAIYALSFDHWIRIHAASSSITTNRTHSAILGAILEIPTSLFASSSHKNHSVWQYSLAARGVTWIDTDGDQRRQQTSGSTTDTRSKKQSNSKTYCYDPRRLVRPLYRHTDLPLLRAKISSKVRDLSKRAKYAWEGVPFR